MFPTVRPEMIVVSRDAMTCDPKSAESFVRSVATVRTLQIDAGSALALWGHDVQIMSDGYTPHWETPHPLHLALNKIVTAETLGLTGSVPSPRFFINFVFPKKEEPYRMISDCQMTNPQPLRLRLHTYKDLAGHFVKIKQAFEEWHGSVTAGGFHEETLGCVLQHIELYSKPGEYPRPPQFGWEILMPECSEVFFPWLELFFHLRRKLPKSMRVSLEFTHPS